MLNLLFVCSRNKLRSPTAETVFGRYSTVRAISCGIDSTSRTQLSGDLIEWADVIFVMEDSHRKKVARKYRELLRDKQLICLGIPDNYAYMQPELVSMLERRVRRSIDFPD